MYHVPNKKMCYFLTYCVISSAILLMSRLKFRDESRCEYKYHSFHISKLSPITEQYEQFSVMLDCFRLAFRKAYRNRIVQANVFFIGRGFDMYISLILMLFFFKKTKWSINHKIYLKKMYI